MPSASESLQNVRLVDWLNGWIVALIQSTNGKGMHIIENTANS